MSVPRHLAVTLTSADTEYSLVIPSGITKVQFQLLGAYDLRYSYVTGKVATPTDPFFTLKAGSVYFWEELNMGKDLTIYFACAAAGQKVQLEYVG